MRSRIIMAIAWILALSSCASSQTNIDIIPTPHVIHYLHDAYPPEAMHGNVRRISDGRADITLVIAKTLGASATLVAATYDSRPTWADGNPIYEVKIKFSAPGRYKATFMRGSSTGEDVCREMPIDVMRENVSSEAGMAVVTAPLPGSWVAQAAQAPWSPPPIQIAVGQVLALRWEGINCPEHLETDLYEWRLEKIAPDK